MQLQLQDFTTLVRTMAAGVQGSARIVLDLTAGSVLRAILEANASLALWMQWLIVQVLTATRAATSAGADLDTWVADFGLTRLPGQAATTSVTFSRITPGFAAAIPAGAQVKTGDTTVSFTVLPDSTNPAFTPATGSYALASSATSITLPAQAAVTGTIGNVQPGAISLLASAMPGIDGVSNAGPAAGGMDAESDTALRARFANFIDSRSRATPAAIAFTIQSLQQGLNYVLTENADPSGLARPGFFTVTIDDGSGIPPTTTLAAVSEALESVRPLGSQFAVQPPVLLTADVALTLQTSSATPAIPQTAVVSAVSAYISTLPIAGPLRTSRVAAIAYAADPTITNVSGVTINGGGDLVPPSSGIIKLGILTVD